MNLRQTIITVVVAWAVLLGAAFLGFLLTGGFRADVPPTGLEAEIAHATQEIVVPLQSPRRGDPPPATQASIADGKDTFQEACAVCHGASGGGDAPLGQSMHPPAMDLGSPAVQHWNDRELFAIIRYGVRFTGMPAWRSALSPQQTWEVVEYIRTLRAPSTSGHNPR